ncbi:hypothetical protein P7K49_015572 [Saguinus oedipus]|uniref:Uncharacterized protein n=1 Tax=Saguinus oedipus TaxID=9490 RepID=A0ABQ9VBN2_SAGOE|nr:hypothetical protein P7K49_015572 [Saguinus oedipus]
MKDLLREEPSQNCQGVVGSKTHLPDVGTEASEKHSRAQLGATPSPSPVTLAGAPATGLDCDLTGQDCGDKHKELTVPEADLAETPGTRRDQQTSTEAVPSPAARESRPGIQRRPEENLQIGAIGLSSSGQR